AVWRHTADGEPLRDGPGAQSISRLAGDLMPINPSIPLSAIGRPQPAPDLLGTAQSVFALKEQQARTQELLRQQERKRQYEALASQYGDDPERFIAEVSRIDP